jgi:tryptophan 2,3-dioxygenase
LVTEVEVARPSYGQYLRIPELLKLQTPVGPTELSGELLFIIGQQSQELWFKQILFDLRRVVDAVCERELVTASQILYRVNRVVEVLALETEILETLPPSEFQAFRRGLKTASGLESGQFREIELASGLRDPEYMHVAEKMVDIGAILSRWPVSLRDALLSSLCPPGESTADALAELYSNPERWPEGYLFAEACSTYDLAFAEWRFHHMRVVERVIGGQSPGTGGSSGAGYLERTLRYRFFPELWQARDRLSRASFDGAS